MKAEARLSAREAEVTELIAWGATKKDVAQHLFISERTVENHARNIYEKTGCRKANELSAWWFCSHYHIPFNLSPLTRKIVASLLLAIFSWGTAISNIDLPRVRVSQARASVRTMWGRRNENNNQKTLIA